jgi:hypothetical protein
VVFVFAFVIASSGGDEEKNDKTAASTSTQQTTTGGDVEGGTNVGTTTGAETVEATPAEPAVPVVRVKDAKPVGGVQKLQFTKGDTIEFKVVSDTADEIHFHGYDVAQDVKAGGSTTFKVKATIEGRFVVELEDHGQQIAEVEVDPS